MNNYIFTFQHTINYGGCLQCFALYHIVKKISNDCKIINYSVPNQKHHSFAKTIYHSFVEFFLTSKKRMKNTSLFMNQMEFTAKIDSNGFDNLDKTNNRIIVGSDQVWNEQINRGDLTYFLNSMSECKKNMYAISLGKTSRFSSFWNEQLINALHCFDNISFRELGSLKYCLSIDKNITGEVHCDPTLLLTSDQWSKISNNEKSICKNKYLLAYVMPGNKEAEKIIRDKAREIAKDKRLKIIYIGNRPTRRFCFWEKNIFSAGPKEFINLIQFSEFVLTNSFHGTIFSLIFHKQFSSIVSKRTLEENDSRIVDFLTDLNLADRVATDLNFNYKTCKDIEYSKIDNIISNKRDYSLRFLEKMLNGHQ